METSLCIIIIRSGYAYSHTHIYYHTRAKADSVGPHKSPPSLPCAHCFLHLFLEPAPIDQVSWEWACVPAVESECWVWRLVSWALGENPGVDSLFVPTPQPHTLDTHCAGTAGGWAASPSHRTLGNAAPSPYSSCWTGEKRSRQKGVQQEDLVMSRSQ